MYIRYHEAENLYKLYPTFLSMLESWKLELDTIRNRELVDEDIYALCMGGGNGEMASIPNGGISDKTGRIAVNHVKSSSLNAKELAKELMELELILQKIRIAKNSFSKIQNKVTELFYWEEKTWKEVAQTLKVSLSKVKDDRTKAINKIVSISKITLESYKWAIKLIEGDVDG